MIEDLIENYIETLSNDIVKRDLIVNEILKKYGRLLTYIECDELFRKSKEFNLLIEKGDIQKILQVANLRLHITS